MHLVMLEQLEFDDALEKVVLLIARGTGGCNAFSLLPVPDAEELDQLRLFAPDTSRSSRPMTASGLTSCFPSSNVNCLNGP